MLQKQLKKSKACAKQRPARYGRHAECIQYNPAVTVSMACLSKLVWRESYTWPTGGGAGVVPMGGHGGLCILIITIAAQRVGMPADIHVMSHNTFFCFAKPTHSGLTTQQHHTLSSQRNTQKLLCCDSAFLSVLAYMPELASEMSASDDVGVFSAQRDPKQM